MRLTNGQLVPRGFKDIVDLFLDHPDKIKHFRLGRKGESSGADNTIVFDIVEDLANAAFASAAEGASLAIKSVGGNSSVLINGTQKPSNSPLVALGLTRGNAGALDAQIWQVRASDAISEYKNTFLEDCDIGRFTPREPLRMLSIKGGRIGVLDLSQLASSEDVEVVLQDCEILQIRVGEKLGLRSLVIDGVNFSSSYEPVGEDTSVLEFRAPLPILDRASFGYLGEWARGTGSSEVAHLVRGYELAIEKSSSRGLYWFWLVLWGVFSNYGLSPIRPLAWLLLFATCNAITVYISGSEIGLSNDQLQGWRVLLSDEEGSDELERALVSSIEGLTSPLSGLSGRRLVVPNSPFVAVSQVLYGFVALGMVSLSVLSLRRRFKV